MRQVLNLKRDGIFLQKNIHFIKSNYASNRSYLNKINMQRSLNAEEQNSCEGMVTCAECWEVVKSLKHNTSPGIDGLP